MVREEAINGLKSLVEVRRKYCAMQTMKDEIECLDMGIKSLEKELCEDWYDVPSDEMTLEQARQAVKDLRKKLAEHLNQQPCEDAISRADAIDAMSNAIKRVFPEHRDIAEKTMNKLPPVTQKQKIGRWIYIGNSEVNGLKICKCSNCEKKTYGSHKFCPNCGQPKMEEVEE